VEKRKKIPKPITFLGNSLDIIRNFPPETRRQAGHQLDLVQHGLMPKDWKPLPAIGPGVNEIRLRDSNGAFRIIYIAKLEEAVYVLHAFEKKSQKTAQTELTLAKSRLAELLRKKQ
jgi:phage-related protein